MTEPHTSSPASIPASIPFEDREGDARFNAPRCGLCLTVVSDQAYSTLTGVLLTVQGSLHIGRL